MEPNSNQPSIDPANSAPVACPICAGTGMLSDDMTCPCPIGETIQRGTAEPPLPCYATVHTPADPHADEAAAEEGGPYAFGALDQELKDAELLDMNEAWFPNEEATVFFNPSRLLERAILIQMSDPCHMTITDYAGFHVTITDEHVCNMFHAMEEAGILTEDSQAAREALTRDTMDNNRHRRANASRRADELADMLQAEAERQVKEGELTSQASRAELLTLLKKADLIITSAYATPEWLNYGRSEATDSDLEAIRAAINKEPGQ